MTPCDAAFMQFVDTHFVGICITAVLLALIIAPPYGRGK